MQPIWELAPNSRILSHSKANPIFNPQYDQPRYPVFYRHFNTPALTEQWFVNKRQTAKFEKSHFGVTTDKQEIRVYDDNVRLSEIYRSNLEEIQEATLKYLSIWSGRPVLDFDQDPDWNMLRYIDGHFTWHKDKVRFKTGFEHLGTQIILPPMPFSRFDGGSLIIATADSNIVLVPDEESWTYLILPLGYAHCVEKVRGTRYSFTKEIYVRPEQEETSQEGNSEEVKEEHKKDDQK